MKVVIIHTGCANLASVSYAIRRLGYAPTVSADPAVIQRADRLVLPGVGSAPAAVHALRQRALFDVIRACTQPLLGICLGMQLLARHSEEGGGVEALGLIDQPVTPLRADGLPLPHMGWNQVALLGESALFRGIPDGSWFYFVHSYALPPGPATVARCTYGSTFSAAVQRANFFGVQFHPERSGDAGARLLQNFLES